MSHRKWHYEREDGLHVFEHPHPIGSPRFPRTYFHALYITGPLDDSVPDCGGMVLEGDGRSAPEAVATALECWDGRCACLGCAIARPDLTVSLRLSGQENADAE